MIKPRIVLSRCFLKPVRYDGRIIHDEFVEKLKDFVEVVDLCPECDIGLGVPRSKIILVKNNNSKKLIQPDTDKDLTEQMFNYIDRTIKNLNQIDGFLLKSKSPSCAVGSAKLYFKGKVFGKTYGVFAEASKTHFPYLPIEDEGTLKNNDVRFHFLTRIFAFAELKQIHKNISISSLIDFHSRYKYLLMTYSQQALKELGKIVADASININEKFNRYSEIFYHALKKKPSRGRHVNSLMHISGHLLEYLNYKEKREILDLIEKYKNNFIELKVIIKLFRNMAYRSRNSYILNQRYLNPFPDELDL